MRGGSRGSAERSRTSPRLSGCSSVGRMPKPSTKAGWSSGNHRCGWCERAAEHELDVGHRELRPRLDEGVQAAGHHRGRAGAEEIGADHAHRHAVEAHLAVEHAGVRPSRIGHVGAEVVLQVLADRQIDDRLDAGSRRCSAGPMPDSISSCGELNAPLATITSRSACALHAVAADALDDIRRRSRACPASARASHARRSRRRGSAALRAGRR